ncbi:Response regulator receiver domain protein [uncultured archaeon]|nr:Response regulator receiver domain protein [uncultured archaeon]
MHSEPQEPGKKPQPAEKPQAELFRSPDAKVEGPMRGQKRPKVLLVEDNKGLAFEVNDMLTDEGYDVAVAGTFVEAIAKFNELKGELTCVITDMVFPTRDDSPWLNGPALVHYMKLKAPEIPVIAQSSEEKYLNEAKRMGADVTLNKTGLSELPGTIEGLLKKTD